MSQVNPSLNTILLSVTIGVLGWIAYTSHETAVKVGVIVQAQINSSREMENLTKMFEAYKTFNDGRFNDLYNKTEERFRLMQDRVLKLEYGNPR